MIAQPVGQTKVPRFVNAIGAQHKYVMVVSVKQDFGSVLPQLQQIANLSINQSAFEPIGSTCHCVLVHEFDYGIDDARALQQVQDTSKGQSSKAHVVGPS